MTRLGRPVGGLGGAVDLAVGLGHHLCAVAQPLQLPRHLLGDQIDVGGRLVNAEGESTELAAERIDQRRRRLLLVVLGRGGVLS